jgi:hypothetical protein
MSKLRVGSGVTIFVLFFGMALLDAGRHGEWVMAALYVALGVLFLRAGGRQGQEAEAGQPND